jgi:hypothetical protein
MSKLVMGLILSVATVFTVPTVSAAKSSRKDQTASAEKAAPSEVAPPLDKEAQQKLKEHMRMRAHIAKSVKYPATKESLVTTFKGLRDIKPGDRKWLEETLPSKTYQTPNEVMTALGWEVAPAGGTTTAKSGK